MPSIEEQSACTCMLQQGTTDVAMYVIIKSSVEVQCKLLGNVDPMIWNNWSPTVGFVGMHLGSMGRKMRHGRKVK